MLAVHLGKFVGACSPEAYVTGLDLLSQPLELAAVAMGESGSAGEPRFDEVLVLPVAVRIYNSNRSR